jgi:chloramphenicol-sensitive protein RarD
MARASNPTGRAASAGSSAAGAVGRGVQLGVIAYLLWGFLTIYWKQLDAFDAAELIAWRMLCAGAVMLVVVTVRRTWPAITAALRSPSTVARLVVASLLLTANWGSYVWAVTTDRVDETARGYLIAPLATSAPSSITQPPSS